MVYTNWDIEDNEEEIVDLVIDLYKTSADQVNARTIVSAFVTCINCKVVQVTVIEDFRTFQAQSNGKSNVQHTLALLTFSAPPLVRFPKTQVWTKQHKLLIFRHQSRDHRRFLRIVPPENTTVDEIRSLLEDLIPPQDLVGEIEIAENVRRGATKTGFDIMMVFRTANVASRFDVSLESALPGGNPGKDVMSFCREQFGAHENPQIAFHTHDLDISRGSLVEITAEAWELVAPRIRSCEVTIYDVSDEQPKGATGLSSTRLSSDASRVAEAENALDEDDAAKRINTAVTYPSSSSSSHVHIAGPVSVAPIDTPSIQRLITDDETSSDSEEEEEQHPTSWTAHVDIAPPPALESDEIFWSINVRLGTRRFISQKKRAKMLLKNIPLRRAVLVYTNWDMVRDDRAVQSLIEEQTGSRNVEVSLLDTLAAYIMKDSGREDEVPSCLAFVICGSAALKEQLMASAVWTRGERLIILREPTTSVTGQFRFLRVSAPNGHTDDTQLLSDVHAGLSEERKNSTVSTLDTSLTKLYRSRDQSDYFCLCGPPSASSLVCALSSLAERRTDGTPQ
ncbi:hypothetical protein HDZ31DRAFT_65747 [Schizophyllum fasciatum]